MSDDADRSVEERLARLEAAIADLQRDVARLSGATTARAPADMPPPTARPRVRRPTFTRPPVAPSAARQLLDRGPEYWISRVGVGLLLVGLALLFKYAVDRGWLTPWIRVAFGLALGGTLATLGFRLSSARRRFSQILIGGASATWYITGFAAFQLLALVSHPVAFTFMVGVTLFTFWTSIRQDDAALALVGAAGGLSTPFLLYTGSGSIPGLVTYTVILLTGTSGIYLLRGWRSLLWTTAVGGWMVFALALENRADGDDLVVQLGVVGFWVLFWLTPVLRELLAEQDPDRWPRPPLPAWANLTMRGETQPLGHLALLVFAVPIVVLITSIDLTDASDRVWGIITAAIGVLYWAMSARLRHHVTLRVLTSAHRVTTVAFAVVSAGFLLDNHAALATWAGLALVAHVGARALGDRALGNIAHLLFAIVGLWLATRLVAEGAPDRAVANLRALTDAAVIAIAFLTARWLDRGGGIAYRILAHGAILAWLWRELAVLPGGNGLVTTAWGLYGLALVVFLRPARRLGLATMFAAVGKLVLYDLTNVDPLWRILLFLSFGVVFLALGYYVPALWRDEDGEAAPTGG